MALIPNEAVKRCTLLFVLAACLSACGGASQQTSRDPELVSNPPFDDGQSGEAQADYERVLNYIDNEQWAEAKVMLTRILSASPDDADAHAYMGVVLEKQNDLAGAERSYLAALERKPGLAAAAQNLAALYLSADPPRTDDAIKHLEKALHAEPNHVGLLQNLGYARAAKGDVPGAVKAYELAIAKGDSPEVRLMIASVLFDAKEYAKVVPHAKKVLEGAKDDASTFATAGLMLAYGKAYKDCVRAYDRAIKLKGDDPEMFVRRGTCKHELGDEEAALTDFQASIRVKPDYATGYYYLGLAQLQLEKRKSAEFSIQKAVEYGKDTPIGKRAKKKLRELQRR